MVKQNMTDIIKNIINDNESADTEKHRELFEIIESSHIVDIAEILEKLTEKERKLLYERLPHDALAELIPELALEFQEELILILDNEKLKKMFGEMSDDDIADIFGELSEREVKHLMKLLDREEQEDVGNLINYDSHTAGGLMTTDFFSVESGTKIRDVIADIKRYGDEAEMVYYVYVIESKTEKLLGVASLKDLLINKQEIVIDRVMKENIVHVKTDTDQEEVAEIFSKYDLLAVPVLDENDRVSGIITVDDIIDVIKEEATEDIYAMAGLSEDEDENKNSIASAVKIRLPWLMVSFVGELFSALIMKKFGGVISQLVTLSFFVPLIMAMGGNSGSQSSAVMVRKIAMGEGSFSKIKKYLIKETMAGLFLGAISGIMIGIIVYIVHSMSREGMELGIIIGTALFVAVSFAAIFGTFIPLIFERLKIDPAVASGPFITTLNDIGGILIYFTLASIMLKLKS